MKFHVGIANLTNAGLRQSNSVIEVVSAAWLPK